jgi:hypothetical protein
MVVRCPTSLDKDMQPILMLLHGSCRSAGFRATEGRVGFMDLPQVNNWLSDLHTPLHFIFPVTLGMACLGIFGRFQILHAES